jgi:hypothetical protein
MNDMNHDPWTKLTDMAAAHVESCVRAENRPAIQKLIIELCTSTANKRDILTNFLCTPPIKTKE